MQKINLKNRKGQNIVGILEKPIGKILGTVILQHGWGATKEHPNIICTKKAFLESGFQTFAFDTTNSVGESDGDFEKSTLGLHTEDLEDVLLWVEKQDWFTKPLALSGHSKGGYAVCAMAEKYRDKIDYLVPLAPVVSGKLSIEHLERKDKQAFEKFKETGIQEKIGVDGILKRKHWFQIEERLNHDLLPNADKIIMPVLLIVGSEDINIPPEHIKILFDAIPKGNKEMQIIDGATHNFNKEKYQTECTKIIKDWLRKTNFPEGKFVFTSEAK